MPAALVVGPRDVGRLVALLDDTPVLLLTGGPGVGKSTTLDALAALLALRSDAPRLFRTAADDTTRRRPFGLVAGLVGLDLAYPRPPTRPNASWTEWSGCATAARSS